jgi:transcriptional regulator with XRE-family HTH domain
MNVPWMTRRARLLLGMTQAQFAEMFEVDDGTVSRWERGRLRPAPSILAKINEVLTQKGSILGDKAIRASSISKFLVPMDNLKKSIVASKGAQAALQKVGIPYKVLSDFKDFYTYANKSPFFPVSAYKALDRIEKHPDWLAGKVLYAEAHCVATRLNNQWTDLMVAPLPDRDAALIEIAPALQGEYGGFWVHLVSLDGATETI